MFWSIKSKWLDKVFPWRVGVGDWDIKWWQRPFLIFNTWRCNVTIAIQNILGFLFCKPDKKHLWANYSIRRELKIFLISLLLGWGWLFLLDVLYWRFRRKFNLMPKPVKASTPELPTNFLGEVDSEAMFSYFETLTPEQIQELHSLFQKHVKGEVYITKLEDLKRCMRV